jgi:hypothetical protein
MNMRPAAAVPPEELDVEPAPLEPAEAVTEPPEEAAPPEPAAAEPLPEDPVPELTDDPAPVAPVPALGFGAGETVLAGAFFPLGAAAAGVSAAASGVEESTAPGASLDTSGCDAPVVTVDPTANTPADEPSRTAPLMSRLITRDEGMGGRLSFFQDR